MVEHFKMVKHLGQVEVTCWKDPQEWPVGGSDEGHVVLFKTLESRFCSPLCEPYVLA